MTVLLGSCIVQYSQHRSQCTGIANMCVCGGAAAYSLFDLICSAVSSFISYEIYGTVFLLLLRWRRKIDSTKLIWKENTIDPLSHDNRRRQLTFNCLYFAHWNQRNFIHIALSNHKRRAGHILQAFFVRKRCVLLRLSLSLFYRSNAMCADTSEFTSVHPFLHYAQNFRFGSLFVVIWFLD